MENQQLAGFSYFETVLRAYLIEEHPDKAGDEELIRRRSEAAENTYGQLVRDGSIPYHALFAAREELFEGLHFSLYRLISDLIEDNFPALSTREQESLLAKAFPLCEQTAEAYLLSDSLEENLYLLKMDLLGAIALYIEKYGI